MLNAFWNAFVIVLTLGSVLGCWWLLHWTKGISERKDNRIGSTGHVWDHDLVELNSPLPRWWLNLFNITIVFGLAYFLLFPGLGNIGGLLGWTQLERYEEEVAASQAEQETIFARYRSLTPAELARDPQALETGRRLFANNCAMCHGSDGRGATGFPNLADDDWLYGGGHQQILASINQGRMGVMPPLGAALGEDGVREVVEFVVQLSGGEADATLASAGKTRYAMLCTACHGAEGLGNQALGGPNLADSTWLYGGSREAIAASVAAGRTGNMPAHVNLLNEDRRQLLAAYVMSLSDTNGN